jgi:hypothetical protein
MKKLTTILGAAVLASGLLTSCGGSSESQNTASAPAEASAAPTAPKPTALTQIPASAFKIKNQDKALFKVAADSNSVSINEKGSIEANVEFELVKKYTGKPEHGQAFVSVVAIDQQGKPIELSTTTNGEMRSSDSMGEEFLDFLLGDPGSKTKFVFSGGVSKPGTFDYDEVKTRAAAQKIAGFKVLTNFN